MLLHELNYIYTFYEFPRYAVGYYAINNEIIIVSPTNNIKTIFLYPKIIIIIYSNILYTVPTTALFRLYAVKCKLIIPNSLNYNKYFNYLAYFSSHSKM